MGKCHLGLDVADIDIDNNGILSIGVRVIKTVRPLCPLLYISLCYIVRDEDAVFCACLNDHVGDGQSVCHAELPYGFTGELHCLVQRAIDTNETNDMENKVLAGNPFLRLPGKDDLHRLRDLEPDLARHHGGRQIGTADTGGKGSQGAVCAGMAVSADDQVSGENDTLFRKEGMLNAHFTNVIVVG